MAASQDKNFPTLSMGLGRLMANQEKSDMEIICDDVVHPVHTMVVCAQSAFFANALKEEHNFKEARTNTVTLEGDDSETVKAAIKFMYLQPYSDTVHGSQVADRVTFQLSVYILADKYGIGGLREHCAKCIGKLLDVKDFLPELFLRTASILDDNIPENDKVIRPVLGSIAAKNIHELIGYTKFWDIAGAAGGFWATVLRDLISAGQLAGTCTKVPQFTCEECERDVTMALSLTTHLEEIDDDYFSYEGHNTYCPGCGRADTNEKWESCRKNDGGPRNASYYYRK